MAAPGRLMHALGVFVGGGILGAGAPSWARALATAPAGHAGFAAARWLASASSAAAAPAATAAASQARPAPERPADHPSAARFSSARTDDASTSASAATSSGPAEGGSPGAAAAPAFASGHRRVLSERRGAGATAALEGTIHIQNTLNNIIMTLTDKQGFIKTYTSAGQVGFRGARKSQPVAAERAAEELARRALKLGYASVEVRLKGAGNNKQYAVQSLAAAGLTITSLADVTPIPYNGCRPPKRRRV